MIREEPGLFALTIGRGLSLLSIGYAALGLIVTARDPYMWMLVGSVLLYLGTTALFYVVSKEKLRQAAREIELFRRAKYTHRHMRAHNKHGENL